MGQVQGGHTKVIAEPHSSFPADAKTGRIIRYTPSDEFFVCINGINSGGDPTLKGNWRKLEIGIGYGIERGKILVMDGEDGFFYGDADGGTVQ